MTKTTETFIAAAREVHGDKFGYENTVYVNGHQEVIINCSIHSDFTQTPTQHLQGRGCKKCGYEEAARQRRGNKASFIASAKLIHGDRYNYTEVKYVSSIKKVSIFCDLHGVFSQTPGHHIAGQGCNNCALEKVALTKERFICESRIVHSNKGMVYCYDRVEHVMSENNVELGCPIHGYFFQKASDHLGGRGCPKCSGQNRTTSEFVHEANIIHNNKYDYTNTEYKSSTCIVDIICPCHGSFRQKASLHLRGSGCQKCSGWNKTTEEFITAAKHVHRNTYDYSKTTYNGSRQKVEIRCEIHGEFNQRPTHHLAGRGCPKCSHYISKCETEFLDLIGIAPENRQIKIGRYKVDGFDPETNTVWEFDGDFWHGNPALYDPNDINPRTGTTFGELHDKTLKKRVAIEKMGFNVRSIWESQLEAFTNEYLK